MFHVVARKDICTTYMRAAEAEPVWNEAPGLVQAGAGEPGLHCFHPGTGTLGVEQNLAITWLPASQPEAQDTKSFTEG